MRSILKTPDAQSTIFERVRLCVVPLAKVYSFTKTPRVLKVAQVLHGITGEPF